MFVVLTVFYKMNRSRLLYRLMCHIAFCSLMVYH